MSNVVMDSSSTLDERAVCAAKYQRAVEDEFSRMVRRAKRNVDTGSTLYNEGADIPLVRDAFKHLALLPWMQHALMRLINDKGLFGLRLPLVRAWSLAAAWDYELEEPFATPNSDLKTVSSRFWIRAGADIDLWVQQFVSLTYDTQLEPKLVYTYQLHFQVKDAVDVDTYIDTTPSGKELVPMEEDELNALALRHLMDGVFMLVCADQRDSA